jgi:Lysozyme like domain
MVQYAGTKKTAITTATNTSNSTSSSSSGSNTLTFTQLQQLWIKNGGSPAWAPFMAAVAEAESGGRITAYNTNPTTGDSSVGLWQINYFGTLSNSRTATYGSKTLLRRTPTANARAAVQLFGTGAGYTNWPDPFVKAWVSVTAPPKPSVALVQSIQAHIATILGTTSTAQLLSGVAVAGGGTGTGFKSTSPKQKSGLTKTAVATTKKTADTTTKTLLGIGPFKFLTRRQGRELLGGLMVVGGGILMGVGIYVMIRTTSPVKAARTAAKSAAKLIR